MRDRYWLIGGAILFITIMILASGSEETQTSSLDAPQASAKKPAEELQRPGPREPTEAEKEHAQAETLTETCYLNCMLAEYGTGTWYNEDKIAMAEYCIQLYKTQGLEAVRREIQACRNESEQ